MKANVKTLWSIIFRGKTIGKTQGFHNLSIMLAFILLLRVISHAHFSKKFAAGFFSFGWWLPVSILNFIVSVLLRSLYAVINKYKFIFINVRVRIMHSHCTTSLLIFVSLLQLLQLLLLLLLLDSVSMLTAKEILHHTNFRRSLSLSLELLKMTTVIFL